jgi:hypothetical protein
MTFPHGLFGNLDCSRKLLLLLLLWSEKSWLLKGHLAWRQGIKSTGIIKRPFCEGKEGEQKSSVISGTKDNFVWELHNHLAHTFTQPVNLGVDDSLRWGAMILKVDVMHMVVTTWCTRPCGMVLMMRVSTTRLPTRWVSDCEGNHRQRKDLCGKLHSHDQNT